MVIKSLSRKDGTEQIVNYLFKDKDKLSNKDFKPMMMRHNIRSRSLDKIVKEFKANETFRRVQRKNSVKVYHTIISFGKKDKDKITEKILRDFGKKYMELQGKDNIYLMTHHIEKEHIHLHVVMSGTKYLTGVANRISKAEFGQLKVAMQTYQEKRYPELNKSIVEHGKGNSKAYSKDFRQSKKSTLEADLQKAYQLSKSTKDFLDQLKSMGHDAYYRNEKLTGIKYDGETKFRFSRLGYDDKIKALEERENEEKQQLDEIENIRSSGSNSRELDEPTRERNMDDENNIDNEMDLENEQDDDNTR
ncbi:relaxase/mobilization nuclease domain-containing protein [Ferruginibacter sp.]|nr:relaxase/mobilization nuclease domain-containing protein [Ferruginibacter sp.]